jgi:hypothetical protein
VLCHGCADALYVWVIFCCWVSPTNTSFEQEDTTPASAGCLVVRSGMALLHHWVCSLEHVLTTALPFITQGAWYVLSALGLYATTPGTTEYVLGSPVFRHVRIARSAEPYEPYYERSYEQVSSAGTDAGMVLV